MEGPIREDVAKKMELPLHSDPNQGIQYLTGGGRTPAFLIHSHSIAEAKFLEKVSKSSGVPFFHPAATHRVENLP